MLREFIMDFKAKTIKVVPLGEPKLVSGFYKIQNKTFSVNAKKLNKITPRHSELFVVTDNIDYNVELFINDCLSYLEELATKHSKVVSSCDGKIQIIKDNKSTFEIINSEG